jgi:Holliday junction resolvasome RuvABC endonuclease subunit
VKVNILAIDPGTTCGWATLAADGQIESGVVSFKGDTPELDCYGARFNAFAAWVVEKASDVYPHLIVFEDQHFRGKAATVLGVGYQTRLMSVAYGLQTPLMAVHSQTLKKWATGRGRASKDDMKDAADFVFRDRHAWEQWGLPVQNRDSFPPDGDDNEADAILLLCYALEKVKEETDSE